MRFGLSHMLQWKGNLFLCNLLGWRFSWNYIKMMGKMYFFLNRKERTKIIKAIRSVFGDRKSTHENNQLIRDVLRGILSHYWEKYFNAYSSAEFSKQFFNNHMDCSGMDAIQQGLNQGKGVLIITGHFGGVEFMPTYLGINNYPVSIIARFSSGHLGEITKKKASQINARIIDPDQTPNILKAIFDNLKENRIVITQCDEIDEWRPSPGKRINFLGKDIHLDKTINVILRRCGAAIVFAVMHRRQNHCYRFVVSSLEEMTKATQMEADDKIGATVLKFLEQYIYRYPEQWYQWKKYDAIKSVSSTEIIADKNIFPMPFMEPSLNKI